MRSVEMLERVKRLHLFDSELQHLGALMDR